MGRLVTVSRSGLLRETPLAPQRSGGRDEHHAEPLTAEELATVRAAQEDFTHFLQHVFPRSFGGQLFHRADGSSAPFALGGFHLEMATIIQEGLASGQRRKFAFMAPRLHLKSTILNYAFTLWQLFRGYRTGGRDWRSAESIDGIIVSYKDDLATEHIRNLKLLMQANPLTRGWRDRKPQAEAIISYEVSFDGKHSWRADVKGAGILSAMRGRHPKFLVVDDPLSDFANPAEAAEMERINRVFYQSILSLPRPGDPVIVIGTPQAEDDLLHQLASNESFVWRRYPAITGDTALWPEVYSLDVLQRKRREIGEDAFQVEYMLTPLRTVEGYFSRQELEACVLPDWQGLEMEDTFPAEQFVGVYAGMDIGRDVHPTHISIIGVLKEGALLQLYEEFLVHMDYGAQVRRINQLMDWFKVNRAYYDSTRAELDDRGLSKVVHPIKFSRAKKATLAQQLERYVRANPDAGEDKLYLIGPPDSRQIRSMLRVNKRLEATQGADGDHGDAFWSNALALAAAEDGPGLVVIGDMGDMFSRQHQAHWGRNPLAPPGYPLSPGSRWP